MQNGKKNSFGGSPEKKFRPRGLKKKNFFSQFCQKNKNFVRRVAKKKIRSRKSAPRPPRWLMVDPLTSLQQLHNYSNNKGNLFFQAESREEEKRELDVDMESITNQLKDVSLKKHQRRELSKKRLVCCFCLDWYCNYLSRSASLTLIQLCGVRTDPAVTEIVTLFEWKVIDKSPLA